MDSPDLSQVSTLKNMFKNASSFNGIINNWNVSTITDISGLFYGATLFNRPLDLWNTGNITNMSETFRSARLFNEPLDNWNTALVSTMSSMFYYASSFNQNINNWDVTQVTDMSNTFRGTNNFNQPLNSWVINNVTNMSGMFDSSAFNLSLSNWVVSNVTDMSQMFGQSKFNQPINNWDVSNVTDMSQMFYRHRTFDQPLNTWNVSNVTNMSGMFDGWIWANIYNQPLNSWDVSNVTDMSYMFRDNKYFNQPLNNWNVSNVTNMKGMFDNVEIFNQDITGWNVSNVTDMSSMFQETDAFNQNLASWNVSNVTNMSSMFYRALVFNQPLNSWDTSSVRNMSSMFSSYYGTTVFNQPLNSWDTGMVTNMSGMFRDASAFNQNLASWDVSSITNMSTMLSNSGLSQANYDNTLIGWESQTVQNNVTLGATGLNYCDGRNQRQNLIDNSNWSINSDIINCSFVLCTNLISPVNGDTNVPASANLTWARTPGATGYFVTVRIIRGGVESIPFNDHNVVGGDIVGLNLETLAGDDLLEPGDEVFVTIVPYNVTDGRASGCIEESFTVVPSWVSDPTAFKLTFDTTLTESYTSAANQLEIETNSGYPDYLTYDYSIDWGDDQFNNNVTGNITHTYLAPGIYTVTIIGTYPAHYYTYFSDNVKLTSIDKWGTQQWKSMRNAFYNCKNMEYNATDIPDLTDVTNMSQMFYQARLFDGNIDAWNVSNVTDMSIMFAGATAFNQPLNNWDVGNVTNMELMFLQANSFDQPLNNWNTSSVTNVSRMFESAAIFNESIDSWNTSNVTNMSKMFNRAPLFNQPLNSWAISNVTDTSEMFNGASSFNQPLNNWDVNAVLDMSSMFHSAEVFNQNINSWNVSSVTNMSSMFNKASMFNEPLNDWNVSSVTDMNSMFYQAETFNQNINSWNVTNVINMASMFNGAEVFNEPLASWDVNSVVNMSSMFQNAEAFNQPINSWNVSAVANMSSMFKNALLFNQPLNSWDVSSVTLMPSMFEGAAVFNSLISNWNVASVTNMKAMFYGALAFNQPIQNWNTGEVLTMEEMFRSASAFNQLIDSWDVSFVTTMESMFEDAVVYDQTMNSWNVASVTTMEDMFNGATAFNGNIDAWNVRGVTTMEEMFRDATTFNQSINNWRVSGVTNMNSMFYDATAYNQAMNLWNLGNVSMQSAFYNATTLDQNLGDWDISGVSDMLDMLDNTALIRENYDNTLISWSEQTLTSGITLGAEGLPYCDAQEERQSMIDNFGWTFSLDVRDCPIPDCTQLASPLNGDIDVPVNTNITWEHALYAQGYHLTVGTTSGGTDIVNNATVTNETSYEFASDFNTGDTVYVTIIPFNDEGDAVGPCTEESFTISNDPATIPDCTSLTEPLNGAIDIVVTTDLSWNPISNADGYKITIGTTNGGSEILDNENVGNIVTYDLATDLPEDSDIFVTITPYNEQGDSDPVCTSGSFHTEIIPVAPICTNLTIPNTTTDVPIDTNLSWNAVSNATGYLVIVGTTSGGIEVVNNIDVGNATTYDIPLDLQENRLHYVTIIPYNDVDDAMGCIEESFRTGDSTSPPSCSSLITPANNATAVSPSTNLTWTGLGSATGYKLSVGTTDGGTDIFTGNLGNVTTYDLAADLPQSTTIYVTVTPYNNNGDATCASESFTTDEAPLCTTLITPANLATDIAVDTNLEWNASANADGYKLTVTASSSTVNNLTDFDVTTGNSYDFTNNFQQGETVTVKITPYNESGDAITCTSESFTIKSVPLCTNLIAPANQAVDIPANTNIQWAPIASATGYKLTVNASNSTANNLTDFNVAVGTSYAFPNDFEQGETVTVTITPYNEVGDAVGGCPSESFTIKSVPLCTNLIAPADQGIVAEVNDISWNAISGANGYKLTISATNTTANNVTELVVTETSYVFPNDFNQGEIVTVTIKPYNEVGDAIGCTPESFTIMSIPSCTSLVSPLNNATEVAVTTDISWNASLDADGYRISVGTSANGTDIVNEEDVASLTNYTFAENLPSETLIYITITPYNIAGDADGCSSESFETEITVPQCTVLMSPANGETNVPLENIINWNEVEETDGYRISIGTTSGGNDIVDNQDVGSSTSYQHNGEFPFDTEIFVTIIPYNTKGDAIQCEPQSFTTIIPEDETKYGFSPDGDGINDYWHIENIQYYPENIVTIYNRWGDTVFRIENYDNGSSVFQGDANLKTKMGAGRLPSGTYFFNIQIEGESILKKTKGYVVIKR
ncbi:BspA family leucine-rich repeat surface protein [Maribacter sp.]|uniref:BspA family leucine-rich repeat surface protein n=1 Tax=Maribacter sp. TaxID=1897614 RepID=UPI0025C320F5|nr:BspA family leucine-rich repeat surface protein [Maribacter sp.]